MADRYFVETPVQSSLQVVLDDDEARHLVKVMRAKVGETVTLFDGSGDEFQGRISALAKSKVTVEIVSRQPLDRELARTIIIAVALPKGDRQKWLIEKLVELGVAKVIPLATARGVAQPVEQALARLRRQVIEASKQCGRNRLLEIAEPQTLIELSADAPTAHRWFAHPGDGSQSVAHALEASWNDPRPYIVAVGPEGGFADDEARQLREHNWQAIGLGRSILRVETAAIALAAAIGLR